ncbi:MAG: SDR family oxidoreductase [Trebonia sp.]|jgi:NAD(P)-dependent dehydrogenase (short-subunit alcohol dehydrogenase family)
MIINDWSTVGDERIAVVTGAGRGIGRQYALAVAAAGFAVAVADLNSEGAADTVALIEKDGGHAAPFTVDVSDPDQVRALASEVRETFGTVHALVNNAALYHSIRLDSQLTVEMGYWRRMMAVNVESVLLCTQSFAPMMIEQGYGRIVNQASIGAYLGGGGAYAVSKVAVLGVTQGFARELGPHGITVNAIAPGLTFTEATLSTVSQAAREAMVTRAAIPIQGQPTDLTSALLFLVDEQSRWITGQTIIVDGGLATRL